MTIGNKLLVNNTIESRGKVTRLVLSLACNQKLVVSCPECSHFEQKCQRVGLCLK